MGRGSPGGSVVRNLPIQETQETQIPSLGGGDPLEKEMATHSSILAWKTPRTEEPGGLRSTGSRSWTQPSTRRWCRRRKWGVTVYGYWVSFWDDDNVLKSDTCNGHTTLWLYWKPPCCTFLNGDTFVMLILFPFLKSSCENWKLYIKSIYVGM